MVSGTFYTAPFTDLAQLGSSAVGIASGLARESIVYILPMLDDYQKMDVFQPGGAAVAA